MSTVNEDGPILAPSFLFRFAVPCYRVDKKWKASGIQLADKNRLPSFDVLDEQQVFADVRAGWNENGLIFNVRVAGKKQAIWCRSTRLDDSDGFSVWLDTRNTQNIHRAGRFCHQFAFLPEGSGRANTDPTARMISIHRAKQSPKAIDPAKLKVRSEKLADGYLLEAFIPAEAMTGFDTSEHSKLGFTFAVVDRELGWQTFSVSSEFPFDEDPSLWGTLELV